MRLALARVAAAALLLAVQPGAAVAQAAPKVPRIGYISPGASSNPARVARLEAFRQGLREQGYVEGQDIVIEPRWAQGSYDRYVELATELVRLKVDVLVTVGAAGSQAAKRATKTIPIVMTVVNDPLGGGLVESLARPGGNLTGLSMMAPDLVAKQLQVLSEIVPKLSRVALLSNPTSPGSAPQLRVAEAVAPTLGLRLQVLEARTPKEIDEAFVAMGRERAGALVVLAESLFTNQAKQLADQAVKMHLPTIFGVKEHADAGGLVFYGADEFRFSKEHLADVQAVIGDLGKRFPGLPIFLVGTSRGSISAASLGAKLDGGIAGVVLTSSMFRATNPRARESGPGLSRFDFGTIKVPVLIVHHREDACAVSPYGDAASLAKMFPLVSVTGGLPPTSDACEPMSPHGHLGRETETVDAVVNWMLKRPYAREIPG